jgi:hypothetical protein
LKTFFFLPRRSPDREEEDETENEHCIIGSLDTARTHTSQRARQLALDYELLALRIFFSVFYFDFFQLGKTNKIIENENEKLLPGFFVCCFIN